MRPSEVVARATRYLEAHGVEGARESAETLLMCLLETDRAGLYTRERGLDTGTARAYGRALCQRCAGTPLQHLVGEQPFAGLSLKVGPGVFVPRPETELLVEAALEAIQDAVDPVVVDVGTGTGAVALAVKRDRADAVVHATDLNAAAVALAAENAERTGLDIEIHGGDLFDPLPGALRGAVDLAVSNPPYVTPEEYADLPPEVRADPEDALVGGTGVHRRLAGDAPGWLRPGGWLVVEIGDGQGEEVAGILGARPFEDVEVLQDLAGRDRIVRGRLSGRG